MSGAPEPAPPPGVVLVRADNPGPFTLTGTNTWLVADPEGGGAVAVDPGPDLLAHLDAVVAAAGPLGGIAAIAITHRHPDHAPGALVLAERLGVPLAATAQPRAAELVGLVTEPFTEVHPDRVLGDGDRVGPLTAVVTPGHSIDHLVFVTPIAGSGVAFTGDLVLGTGSTLVSPYGGSMGAYLASLARLQRLGLATLCPGHGPVVADAQAKLAEYVAHRRAREAQVEAALGPEPRDLDALLADAYADTPTAMWPAARLPLLAHLLHLEERGRAVGDPERGYARRR